MAEFVLRRTEETLQEYEEMLRIGLFTRDEVKAIVKKTMSYEYKLVRRVKVKKDFLACIQHKVHLLALIKKRRKKIGYFSKKEEIEFAIVGRIHGLFKQCTFRWPDDLQLWMSHIEFCKEWNKKTQLSKVWTAMLQLHGNSSINLWAMAAKWELEDNHSVDNARQIFLRGIRHFPDDAKLWQEYFRMELMHCAKIRQRLALLKDDEEYDQELTEEHLKGEAARIVYSNAVKAIPNDSKLKCGFLDIALVFSFFAGEIINLIIEDILEHHNREPQARSALARLHLNPNVNVLDENDANIMQAADIWNAEKRCWDDFESAIEEIDTPGMWKEYVFFLCERVEKEISEDGKRKAEISTLDPGSSSNKRLKQLLSVLERGHKVKKLTAACYTKYVDRLIISGDVEQAVNILDECSQFMESLDLELKLLGIISKTDEQDQQIVREMVQRLSSATSKMDNKQEGIFWIPWLQYAIKMQDEDYIWEALNLAKKRRSSFLSQMVVMYLHWVLEKCGVEETFEIFKTKLQNLRSFSIDVLKTMVGILKDFTPPDLTAISWCYENAVDDFGKTEPDFWLDYISHILETGPTNVGLIHWKAMKTLRSDLVDEFSEKYALSKTRVK